MNNISGVIAFSFLFLIDFGLIGYIVFLILNPSLESFTCPIHAVQALLSITVSQLICIVAIALSALNKINGLMLWIVYVAELISLGAGIFFMIGKFSYQGGVFLYKTFGKTIGFKKEDIASLGFKGAFAVIKLKSGDEFQFRVTAGIVEILQQIFS